jgi:Zn-finger nucleic acid-binding protein
LHGRSFGEPPVAFDECARCAGLWLGRAEFDLVAERAREQALPVELSTPRAAAQAARRAASPSYRRCPRCGKHMNRRNFSRHSGVILDVCKEHGTWLDAQELEAVLAFIRQGGENAGRERARDEARHAERQQRIRVLPDSRESELQLRQGGGETSSALGPLASFLGAVFGVRVR